MIRYILGYDSRYHLDVKDFVKVKMLDVSSRINYLTSNMMFNVCNGIAPSYLCTFMKISDVHNHATRNSDFGFVIPHVKTQGTFSFMYNGAKLWNNLPVNIRMLDSKKLFKTTCKKHLFSVMKLKESSEFIYY
jgi:hypothetical protein